MMQYDSTVPKVIEAENAICNLEPVEIVHFLLKTTESFV